MTTGVLGGRARCRVRRVDRESVFFDGAAVLVVHVAVVQVIDVAIVQNAGVSAAGTVVVRVTFMVSRHVNCLLPGKQAPGARKHGPARLE